MGQSHGGAQDARSQQASSIRSAASRNLISLHGVCLRTRSDARSTGARTRPRRKLTTRSRLSRRPHISREEIEQFRVTTGQKYTIEGSRYSARPGRSDVPVPRDRRVPTRPYGGGIRPRPTWSSSSSFIIHHQVRRARSRASMGFKNNNGSGVDALGSTTRKRACSR